jgi:hypothetical protein
MCDQTCLNRKGEQSCSYDLDHKSSLGNVGYDQGPQLINFIVSNYYNKNKTEDELDEIAAIGQKVQASYAGQRSFGTSDSDFLLE